MKDVYEVLRQKEADVTNVRHEIQSLKLVSSLVSDELALKDARELLRQKEADVARARCTLSYHPAVDGQREGQRAFLSPYRNS